MKKIQLNYMPACNQINPKSKVSVSSAKLEELNQDIKKKIRQNAYERELSKEIANNYLVKSLVKKKDI